MRVSTPIFVLLAGFLVSFAARATCVVEPKASVPLQDTGGTITLPLEINGSVATFILDTGAQRSLVTEAAVRRLDLARDEWVSTTMRGLGGIERRANADPRSLSLGGLRLVRRTLNHDTSLTVGDLPQNGAGVIDGVLGRDFLALFDLDIDVPGRRLTLFSVHDCGGRFLPWQGSYAGLPVSFQMEGAPVLPVAVDGVALRALLDTGASGSLVAAPGEFRLGLQPAVLADDPVDRITGLGPHVLTMSRHTFRSLRVGGETLAEPEIWVGPVHLTPIVDMLLGADWLADRRIWLSFATQQLFVAER